MTELGDIFREWNKAKQEKRASNAEQNLAYLERSKIPFRILSDCGPHVRVGDWDFWCSTGLFINLKTKKKGRGIRNFLKAIGHV